MRSILRQGHRLSLYCYREPAGIPAGVEVLDASAILPENRVFAHSSGSIALFSDWFRYELLRRGLGTWVDTDMYLLSALDCERAYLFGEESPGCINNAVLRLPPDSPLLKDLVGVFEQNSVPPWLPLRHRLLTRLRQAIHGGDPLSQLPWGSTGPAALTALARRFGIDGEACPSEVFNPVHWRDADWIADPAIGLDTMTGVRTVGVHLWNECIRSFKNLEPPKGSFLERLHREGIEEPRRPVGLAVDEAESASVAVVIPCFRQAHFLAGAIESALGQSVQPSEVIVVDDGSDDDIGEVARRYPGVVLIRQDNRGLAGARNAGLRAARSDRIIFLDADDRLLPDALRLGLQCLGDNADAAFAYGAYRVVQDGSEWQHFVPISGHTDLIRCNWIGCTPAAMFDRGKLLAIGGFDESLGMCEDWDVFLRLSRAHGIASHPNPVALYVKHDSNMSNDEAELLRWVEVVRQRERLRGLTGDQLKAWTEGAKVWRSIYDRKPRPFKRLARRLARLAGRG